MDGVLTYVTPGALILASVPLARWVLLGVITLWSLRADDSGRKHALTLLELLLGRRGTSRSRPARRPSATVGP